MKFKTIKRSKYPPTLTLADVPDGRYEVSASDCDMRSIRMLYEGEVYCVNAKGARASWQNGNPKAYTVHQRLDTPLESVPQKWDSLADVPEGVVVKVYDSIDRYVRFRNKAFRCMDNCFNESCFNPFDFTDCTPTGDFIEVEWENECSPA